MGYLSPALSSCFLPSYTAVANLGLGWPTDWSKVCGQVELSTPWYHSNLSALGRFSNSHAIRMWWHMPISPAQGKQRQGNCKIRAAWATQQMQDQPELHKWFPISKQKHKTKHNHNDKGYTRRGSDFIAPLGFRHWYFSEILWPQGVSRTENIVTFPGMFTFGNWLRCTIKQ